MQLRWSIMQRSAKFASIVCNLHIYKSNTNLIEEIEDVSPCQVSSESFPRLKRRSRKILLQQVRGQGGNIGWQIGRKKIYQKQFSSKSVQRFERRWTEKASPPALTLTFSLCLPLPFSYFPPLVFFLHYFLPSPSSRPSYPPSRPSSPFTSYTVRPLI